MLEVAFDGKEIEVKVRIEPKQRASVEDALRAEAGCSSETEQIDVYLTSPHEDFTAVNFPYKWLSVRRRGTSASLNFKHFHPEGAEHHTHCDEFQVAVGDADATVALLAALGFVQIATVHKRRTSFEWESLGVEVAIDDVAELGLFVEVEATRDAGGIEATRAHVQAVLDRLGLADAPEDPRGYPFRLIERRRGDRTID